jgi:hypothetical protein
MEGMVAMAAVVTMVAVVASMLALSMTTVVAAMVAAKSLRDDQPIGEH